MPAKSSKDEIVLDDNVIKAITTMYDDDKAIEAIYKEEPDSSDKQFNSEKVNSEKSNNDVKLIHNQK